MVWIVFLTPAEIIWFPPSIRDPETIAETLILSPNLKTEKKKKKENPVLYN